MSLFSDIAKGIASVVADCREEKQRKNDAETKRQEQLRRQAEVASYESKTFAEARKDWW